MTNMAILRQETDGVTYADVSDPDMTVRFKNTSATKSLDGVRVTNVISEIIANDLFAVTVGTATVKDAVSVRIRISGSLNSHDRKKSIMSSLSSLLGTWADEHVTDGFSPTTPPTVPI